MCFTSLAANDSCRLQAVCVPPTERPGAIMQIKGGATRHKQATGQACAVSDISSARRAGQRYYKRFLCPTHEKISSPWSCSQLLTRGFFAAAAAEVAAAAPPASMPFRLFLPASSASSSFSMRRTYAHITGHTGQLRSEIRALSQSGTHTLHMQSNLVMPTQSEGKEIKRTGKETKQREKQQKGESERARGSTRKRRCTPVA